jgi:ribosomal protein S15P/S13E
MPRNPTRDVILSNEQIRLIVEGLEMLRFHENGNPNDGNRRMKLADITRLEQRLQRRLLRPGRGHTDNYAEKL